MEEMLFHLTYLDEVKYLKNYKIFRSIFKKTKGILDEVLKHSYRNF